MPDHYIFTDDPRANRNVDVLREYAEKYDIKYFYDIKDRSDFKANPDYRGVCHVALAEEGHNIPGEVMFGTDSHTCNAGAFGTFATGIGNTDAGFVLGTGKLLVKVPPTLLFRLEGEMPDYLQAKDLILHIIGEIGVREYPEPVALHKTDERHAQLSALRYVLHLNSATLNVRSLPCRGCPVQRV